MTFFVSFYTLCSKVYLPMNIATPAFFPFLFAESIFFHPFPLCVSFNLKRVSYKQHIDRSCFFTHSATFCLLIGALSPFTFKVLIDRCALVHCFLAAFVVLPFLSWSFLLVCCFCCCFLFFVVFLFVVTMRFLCVYIYPSVSIVVYFKLIGVLSANTFLKHMFTSPPHFGLHVLFYFLLCVAPDYYNFTLLSLILAF